MTSEDRRPSAAEEDEHTAEADRQKEKAFAEKRKQHYNEMAQIKKMMAAKALEDDDEDEDSEDEIPDRTIENGGYIDSDQVLVAAAAVASCEASVDCEQAQNGQWAFGPDDLHGGPKLPGGKKFERETSQGSDARAPSKEQLSEASGDAGDTGTPSACVPRGMEAARPALVGLADGFRKRPSGIVWDEATIAEHDLERGTRQKIEEPNTPWIASPQMSNENTPGHGGTPSEFDNGDGRNVGPPIEEDVRKKLLGWYRQEGHRQSIQERIGDEVFNDDTCEDEDQAKKAAFADKRKNHYNEMDLVRKMMAAKLEDEEDDEDDDDD